MMSGRNTTLIVSVIVGLAFVMAVPYPASAEETAAAQAPESLTLDDAIATALELNPRLHEAEQNLRAARATVVQARAGKSLTANLEVVRTHVSDVAEFVLPVPAPPPEYISFEQVTFGRKDQTQGTLTVAKPLYTGGAVPAAVRQASAGVSAQSEQLTRVRQSVVNDVKQAYYGVLLAADLVRVAEQTVDAAGEYVRLAQAIFDAGTAPRFDVLRAETRLAESEQLLIQARNGLDLSRAALNNAMGVPQDREYDLATSFVKPLAEVDDLAALVAQAEQARPETRQVEAQIAAAGAAADLARSAKHPTLGVGWVYNRVLDMSAFQVSNWTLALQAAITIFDGKQTSAAVARARREQDSARALLEQLRQGIALEVRQAYLSLGSARERIAAAAKGVEQAEEAYRIATVRYDAGVSISVEVIDAEVALSSARNQYAHAVYDYNVGLAQLEYAVGATQPGEQQSAAAPILRMEQPAS